MFISSRTIIAVLGSLVLAGANARAEMPGIQGDVTGADKKPLSGADVRIERTNGKNVVATVKTDQKGHYVAKNLPVDNYNVTVTAAGMATTAATNIKTRSDGASRIDFTMKRAIAGGDTKSAPEAKKKVSKRMVWVPAETGSNLGGRWVEVDETGNTGPSNLNVKRAGAGTVNAIQQGGSGRSLGGN